MYYGGCCCPSCAGRSWGRHLFPRLLTSLWGLGVTMSIFWTWRRMLLGVSSQLCAYFPFLYKMESQKEHLFVSFYRSHWSADRIDAHRWPSRKWLLQPNYSAPFGRTDCCTEELSYLVFAGITGSPAWRVLYSCSCKEIYVWLRFTGLPSTCCMQGCWKIRRHRNDEPPGCNNKGMN